MSIKIRTRTVGMYFATVGQAVAGNGRIVHETRLMPYGFEAAAVAAVEAWAADRGVEVRS